MQPPILLFDCRLDSDVIALTGEVLASGALASGTEVPAFERELADYLNVDQVVAVSDLSHAMEIALRLAGVGPGDDVLTLAFNCLSSNVAIASVGACPVWVDVDPVTATMCVADAERAITSKTRALVSYHVSGYPSDVASLNALCARYGIKHIVDANNALCARFGGRLIGTDCDFGIFSFYPNRQVGAVDGAAIYCKRPKDAMQVLRLRRFGINAEEFRDADGEIDATSDVPRIGMSAALSNVNAAIARLRLRSLDQRMALVQKNVMSLVSVIENTKIELIRPISGGEPSWWTLLVRSASRDTLMRSLKAKGIQCSKLHQPNDVYSGFSAEYRSLPGTRALEASMLALPCGWWLESNEIDRIADALKNACL